MMQTGSASREGVVIPVSYTVEYHSWYPSDRGIYGIYIPMCPVSLDWFYWES